MERLITEEIRQKLAEMETVEELIDWLKTALDEHTEKILEEKARTGKKIVGTLCVLLPREILDAADVLYSPPVVMAVEDTDETRQNTSSNLTAGESLLPKTFCPIPKQMLGNIILKKDPMVKALDYLVAPAICDCRAKAYEYMEQYIPMILYDVPKKSEDPDAIAYFKNEIIKLRQKIEEISGSKISDKAIRKSVALHNRNRILQYEHCLLRANHPSPIKALDSFFAMTCEFRLHAQNSADFLEILNAKMKQRVQKKQGHSGVRVVLSGAPMCRSTQYIHQVINECGALVAAEDNCTQTRRMGNFADAALIDENAPDIMAAIAEKYMRIPCAAWTPNSSRIDLIKRLVRQFNAKGVIYHALEHCHPFNAEYGKIKQALDAEHIPLLRFDNTFSTSDREQMRLRLEGFIEMLGDK
jgi:benzoyl-CoA reductase/2-hydroxyglutaryl-CoA dehydratase subunit BcrC/BadD/HgdB